MRPRCDLADAAAISGYIAAAAEALGGIDVLVNNASGFGMSDDRGSLGAGHAGRRNGGGAREPCGAAPP